MNGDTRITDALADLDRLIEVAPTSAMRGRLVSIRTRLGRLTPQAPALQGATDPGDPATVPASAGEFAARWNALPPDRRERWAHQIARNAEVAIRCELHEVHAETIHHLRAEVERLARYGA